MPHNVRNFWIEGSIDGRSSGFSGGPQSKSGGFSLTIRQRAEGDIITAVRVSGRVLSDGSLLCEVENATASHQDVAEGKGLIQVKTKR